MVSHIIPVISIFLGIFNIQHIIFDPLGQKLTGLESAKSLRKFRKTITFKKNLTSKSTRGGGYVTLAPGLYAHTHAYTHTHTCTYTTHMCAHICTDTHACAHTHAPTRGHMHIFMHTHMHTHMHTNTYAKTCTHTAFVVT